MQRVFLLLFFILFGLTVASACTCISTLSNEKVYRKTKAVFVGRLIEIGTQEIKKPDYSPLYALKFKVERKWKGVEGDEVTLFTRSRPNMCSAFDFQEGESYLLYVNKDSVVSSGCASSVELKSDAAKERIKDLDSFWFRLRSRLWFF